MTVSRRRLLQLAAMTGVVTGALPAASRFARADAYPVRPVRFIVGQAAGSGSDIFARIIGQWLSERLGQSFVIDNRPGATGNLAVDVVAQAPADGYTVLFVNNSNTINATLYEKLDFTLAHDFVPVAGILDVPVVMEVNPGFPAKTVPEFIAYAKANPGKINMASAGTGSTSHMCGELFKYMTGVNLVHVPYRGTSPALVDLMAGQVQVMFDVIASSKGYVNTGQLRALAVTTTQRSDALLNVPPLAEFVPGYEASAWGGMSAPKNTPPEIVNRLNAEINKGLDDPGVKAQLAAVGAVGLPGSPADFGKFLADDTEKWGKVVKFAGVKLE